MTTRSALLLDILEEHHEELDFLWGQRRAALRSPLYTAATLGELEGRIEAHVQGLLVAGEGLPEFLAPRLTAEGDAAFAAAYPLLRSGNAKNCDLVLGAFLTAEGPASEGIGAALAQACPEALLPRVAEALTGPPPLARAAARALAVRSPGHVRGALPTLVKSADPATRAAAWSAAALAGIPLSGDLYQSALRDDDPVVRREALMAAAWAAQPWLLDHCRKLVTAPRREHWDAVLLLATVGGPEDAERVRRACKGDELGPARFQALGATGHPSVVEDLLEAMGGKEVRAAVEAGKAFTQITGRTIDSAVRVALPPEDGHEPDEVEKEFLDEEPLPDVQRARDYWGKVRGQMVQATRWSRGVALDSGDASAIAFLDREALHAARLRGKLAGTWAGTLADLERFPQSPTGKN